MSNPYLIPLRASSGTNSAGPTSTSTTKKQQATVLMSSTPAPSSSFGGSNNTRSDWLLSSSHNVNIAQQQQFYLHQGIPMKQPKAPSVGSTSSSSVSSNRRNSIDRAATTTTTSHITVVKLKHEQEIENNKPANFPNEVINSQGSYYSPSSITTTKTRMTRNVVNHQTTREPDDDDINRFIYEDNEKTLLENSDGSPIRCLDDVRDILPPSNDDAAKQLARMIQEQGKALLEIRAREQELLLSSKEKSPPLNFGKNSVQQHEPPSRRIQQQNNATENFMLPTTFRPVPLYQNINNTNNYGQKIPPPRWKVPPTLPPRRRLLVADGPRLDLLEMLDRLDEEDREGGNQKRRRNSLNNNGSLNSIASSSSSITSELWVFIFEFLDPRTLCRVSAVSRRWLCIARSEFLWEPILSNNFQHLIQEEEEEVRFQQRTGTAVGGMAPPPPRPSDSNDNNININNDNNSAPPSNSDTDPISMCPSLARISNFVNQHRGRIQQELTAVETRIQRTEERIASSFLVHQNQSQHLQQASSIQMTGPELELTNERAQLLRHLQELEPKFRTLMDRLRDSEATQSVQSRALNEAIVSSRRSGLQLQAIHRRSQIVDRRHKELLALEDLERRICMSVLAGAGTLLPVSLRKSIRCFSQLELLLMSCATQEALSELPRRWQKVKDAGVSVEVLEELRRKIEESEDPNNGVLGKLVLMAVGERRKENNNSNNNYHRNGENSNTTTTTTSFDDGGNGMGSKRIRFADSLLSRRHNSTNNNNNENDNHNTPVAASHPQQQRTFAQDTIMTKQRLIAEMALNYVGNDYGLEKFLFS